MARQFYLKHKRKFDLLSGLFLSNTVLGNGLVVAPVVIASYTLKNGVVLGLSFFIITFVTVFLSSFISAKIPYTIRVVLYMIISSLVYIPTAMLFNHFMPETVYKVGIFLPLLITNSLITTRIESRFKWKKRGVMVIDLLSHALGFLVVIVLVGLLREVFGTGRIWDIPISGIPIKKTPALMLPFGGFFIIGFMAALLQKVKILIREPKTQIYVEEE